MFINSYSSLEVIEGHKSFLSYSSVTFISETSLLRFTTSSHTLDLLDLKTQGKIRDLCHKIFQFSKSSSKELSHYMTNRPPAKSFVHRLRPNVFQLYLIGILLFLGICTILASKMLAFKILQIHKKMTHQPLSQIEWITNLDQPFLALAWSKL